MATREDVIKFFKFEGKSTPAKVEYVLWVVYAVLTLIGYFVQRKYNPTMATFISVIFVPIIISGPLYIYLIDCLDKGQCKKLSWIMVISKLIPITLLLITSFLTFSGDVISSTLGSFKSL